MATLGESPLQEATRFFYIYCKVFVSVFVLAFLLFFALFSHPLSRSHVPVCRSQHPSVCRFSGTPGDVLKRHTEACCDLHTFFLRAFFSVSHHIHRTQNTYHRRHTTTIPRAHTHTTQHNNNTTPTQHKITRRKTQRDER